MADDIVTRLRASYHASRTCFELSPDEIHDMKQAADVIQRLRAYVLSFPCSCWVNKPKCVRCEVAEAVNES